MKREPSRGGSVTSFLAHLREKHLKVLLLLAPGLFIMGIFAFSMIQIVQLSFYRYDPTALYEATFTLETYDLLLDPWYVSNILNTLKIGVIVTVLALIIGYPIAYFITQLKGTWKTLSVIIVVSPLMISLIISSYAWVILLAPHGTLNTLLMNFNIIDKPIKFMYSELGVMIGLLYGHLPFMVLALHSSIEALDKSLPRAAKSLGAGSLRVFYKITLPLTMPGILAGSIIVFALNVSAFMAPLLLGGRAVKVISILVYENAIGEFLNWPAAAVLALVLLLGSSTVIIFYNKYIEKAVARWLE